MISTPVLIIGAGPSGMVSALLLAKNGIPSVLVEKRAIPGKHPKAHEISGRTLEILNTAGIPIEELESEASPHEDGSRIIFCRTIKEEIGRSYPSNASSAFPISDSGKERLATK